MAKKNTITIDDVAKLAGVSRTTVSFYLNHRYNKMSDKTRIKIEKVIEETGFVPNVLARSLNNKQSYLIGVMVKSITNMTVMRFLEGVNEAIKKYSYQMIVTSTNGDLETERRHLDEMSNLGVDGLIVEPSDSFDLLWKAMKRRIPLVAVNPPHASAYQYWIRSNDYEAVYSTLEKLADSGYRRFVLLTPEFSPHSEISETVLAFNHATDLKHVYSQTIYDSDTLENNLLQEIKVDEKTIFFASTPEVLSKIYRILYRYREYIPEQIGLLGFDSREWSEMVIPSVTTIIHPYREEGVHAVDLLMDLIRGTSKELPDQIFSCTLNLCESVIFKDTRSS